MHPSTQTAFRWPLRSHSVTEADRRDWMTAAEVADFISPPGCAEEDKVKAQTVLTYHRRKEAGIPEATKFGRTPMWRRTEIEAWHANRPGPGNWRPREEQPPPES